MKIKTLEEHINTLIQRLSTHEKINYEQIIKNIKANELIITTNLLQSIKKRLLEDLQTITTIETEIQTRLLSSGKNITKEDLKKIIKAKKENVFIYTKED